MSLNIKALLMVAVLAIVVVGTSTANAAQVRSIAQRRQHPGAGYFTNVHHVQNHAVTRAFPAASSHQNALGYLQVAPVTSQALLGFNPRS